MIHSSDLDLTHLGRSYRGNSTHKQNVLIINKMVLIHRTQLEGEVTNKDVC